MNDIQPVLTTRAVLALVFALLALFGACPCLGSLAAIGLGLGERHPVGRAGFHLGWISLLLGLIVVGVAALFLVVGVGVDMLN